MLVLTRKQNEQIELTLPTGEVITLTNVRNTQHACRIGIEAPADVKIVRRELSGGARQNPTAVN